MRVNDYEWLGVTDPDNTFENIKPVSGFKDTLTAFSSIIEKNAAFNMLMVYGGVGNGKSRCCEAVVMALEEEGAGELVHTRRDRWCDIVRELKSRFGSNKGEYDFYFKAVRNRERLIIDDVGCGSSFGVWEQGELDDIIDYRYEKRLFTILTTNLDIKQFPDRILSRFRDRSCARLILNEAGDYRLLKEGVK